MTNRSTRLQLLLLSGSSVKWRGGEEEDMALFVALKLLANFRWDGCVGVFAEHPDIVGFGAWRVGAGRRICRVV